MTNFVSVGKMIIQRWLHGNVVAQNSEHWKCNKVEFEFCQRFRYIQYIDLIYTKNVRLDSVDAINFFLDFIMSKKRTVLCVHDRFRDFYLLIKVQNATFCVGFLTKKTRKKEYFRVNKSSNLNPYLVQWFS